MIIKKSLRSLTIAYCLLPIAHCLFPLSSAAQSGIEKKFDSYLDTKNIDLFIKELSARPHHVGSPGDKANAEYLLAK